MGQLIIVIVLFAAASIYLARRFFFVPGAPSEGCDKCGPANIKKLKKEHIK